MEQLKQKLESAWEDGFFYNLRQGHFNRDQYLELKELFESFHAPEETAKTIDRRLVTLVWLIPTFVSWQEERLASNGVNTETIHEVGEFFYSQCEKILGLP